MELEKKIYNKILKLSEKGERLTKKQKYDKAIIYFEKALELLPVPKVNWDAGTWIYTALGDCYFWKREYRVAKDLFYSAYNCPDGVVNPFILLRLGECLYECSEFELSREYLLRAYMIDGEDLFIYDDPKYYDLIKSMI